MRIGTRQRGEAWLMAASAAEIDQALDAGELDDLLRGRPVMNNQSDDELVALMRAELDNLTLTDEATLEADVRRLFAAIVTADTTKAISGPILELAGTAGRDYARAVMSNVAALLGVYFVFEAPTVTLPGRLTMAKVMTAVQLTTRAIGG
ncbi:hypothetical protein [Agromyces sp. NPDC058104]|uniref:hypothetical protein n=1 Tax=Agromyces sp. NPDC058104 TaxID=3346342 RepID=UPI0036DE7C9E